MNLLFEIESLSPKCEPAKAYEADLDKMITPEDSSKAFMAVSSLFC